MSALEATKSAWPLLWSSLPTACTGYNETKVRAGKAALALENHEIVPGRRLRTGGLKDLFAEKDEIRTDRIQVGQGKKPAAGFMQQPGAPVRRPGAGGRGGLGQKRGLGYSAPKPANAAGAAEVNGHGPGGAEENKKPKSNADFKAMFVSGGTQ